ncbi:hypothetical protein CHH69_17955 [Terribacillus saccharophilus]|nr:hypothetical protein CHH69_17955 [Terribacillus saccharophilus]
MNAEIKRTVQNDVISVQQECGCFILEGRQKVILNFSVYRQKEFVDIKYRAYQYAEVLYGQIISFNDSRPISQ